MADENTSTETSTGTGDASTGGGDGGGSPVGFVPQAVFDRAEAQRRDLQSQLDRLRAAPPAPAAPAAPEASTSTGTSAVESELAARLAKLDSLNPDAFADAAMARFAQATALREAEATLKTEFPHARGEAFQGHSTPEEMRAAVMASHQSETEARAAVRDQVRAELAAQIKEQHGIDLAPAPQAPATSDGNGDTGPATVRDLAGMSFADLNKLDDAALTAALART